jgi:uncharacterized membrane protein YhaH (DUF805 family)
MLNAIGSFFKNYFNFTGRSSRSEYWWFLLAYLIVKVVIAILEGLIIGIDYAGSGLASNVYFLALMIGLLSLNARRLQDRGHTGWWQFVYLIPIIPLIYFGILFLFTENSAHAISAGLVLMLEIGILITLIIILCLPPKEDENKWGKNPLLEDY